MQGFTNSSRNNRTTDPARPVKKVVSHGFYFNICSSIGADVRGGLHNWREWAPFQGLIKIRKQEGHVSPAPPHPPNPHAQSSLAYFFSTALYQVCAVVAEDTQATEGRSP